VSDRVGTARGGWRDDATMSGARQASGMARTVGIRPHAPHLSHAKRNTRHAMANGRVCNETSPGTPWPTLPQLE
jgi:hypothetical protein